MNTQNQKRNVLVLVLVIFSIYIAAYGVKLPASIRGAFHSALTGLGYDLSGHTGFAREVGSSTVDFKTKNLTASGSGWFDGDVHVGGNILASVGSLINNHAGLSNLDFPSSGHTGFASSGAIPGNGSFTLNGLVEKNYANLTNKPTSASWTLSGLSEKSYSSLTDTPTNASYTLNGLAEKNYDNLTNKPTSASWTLTGLFEKAYSSLTNKPDSASWTHDLLTAVSTAIGHDSRYYQVASYDNFRIDSGELTGFVDQTSTSIAFVDGTRTFTITGTNFPIWSKGLRYLKNTESVTLSTATATTYIYYNASQVIATSTSVWSFSDGSVPIAIVYFDGQYGKLQDERHGIQMDGKTHEYIHVTIGTRFASGLAGTFNDTLATITSGIIYDEDLRHVIPQQATFPCFYRMGSNFKFTSVQSKYYVENANILRYDNGGVLTDVTNNNYMVMWFFVTADPITPIWCMVGQREDNTLALARTNNTFESLSLSTLPVPEIKVLYRVILKRSGTSELFQEATDFRNTTNLPTQNYVSTDHGALSGLLDDDHSQYLNLLGRGGQTINDFIQALYYDFDTASTTNPAYKAGRLFYDIDNKVLAFYPDVDGPVLQIGQEMWIRAKNETGAQINDGQAVYISSASTGIHPNARLAQANATSTSDVIAVATHNISHNQFGYFTLAGIIRGLNTSAFIPGSDLYLSQTTPGSITTTVPPTGICVKVGHVTSSHSTEGAIFVHPQINGSLERAYFADGITVNGAATATTYYGDGSHLTGIVSGVSSFSSLGDVSTDTGNIGKFLKMTGNKIYSWDTASGSTGTSVFSGLSDVSTNTTYIGKVLSMSGDKAYSWVDQASGTSTSGSGTPVVTITGSSVATSSSLVLTNSNTSYMTVSNNDAMAFEVYIKAKHDLGYSGGRLAGLLKNANGTISFVETGYEKLSSTDSTRFSFIASYTPSGQLIVVASSPANLTVTGWAMTTNFTASLAGGSGVSYLKDLLDVSSSSTNIGKSLYMTATNTYAWQDTFYSLPATLSCFIASCSSSQTFSGTSVRLASFTATPTLNTLNEFSPITSKWTASKFYKKYIFYFKAGSTNGAGAIRVYGYVNGAFNYDKQFNISGTPSGQNWGSFIMNDIAPGTTVEIQVYPDNSVAFEPYNMHFSGYEIPDATTVVQSTAQAVQTYVNATKNSLQLIPNNSETTVVMDTKLQDNLSEYNSTSGAFTASRDGKYSVVAGVQWDSNNTGTRSACFKVNGTIVKGSMSNMALANYGQYILKPSAIVSLKAGDVLTLSVWQNSGNGLNILDGNTYTCGLQITEVPSTDIIPTIAHVNTTEVTVIASSSGGVSLPNNSVVQITGLSEDQDIYSEFNGSVFTSKVAQTIQLKFQSGVTSWFSSAGYVELYYQKNSGDIVSICKQSNWGSGYSLSAVSGVETVKLNAGDTLKFFVRNTNDSAGSSTTSRTSLQITRLNTSVTDLASLGGADTLLIASRATNLSLTSGVATPVTGMGFDVNAYGEMNGATFTSRVNQTICVNITGGFAGTGVDVNIRAIYGLLKGRVSPDMANDITTMLQPSGPGGGASLNVQKIISIKAGETICFCAYQASGVALNLTYFNVQIVRLNPPGTTYQTTNRVICTYMLSGDFTINNSGSGGTYVQVTFNNKVIDTQNNMPNGATFTAPISGYYEIDGTMLMRMNDIQGDGVNVSCFKNGSVYASGFYVEIAQRRGYGQYTSTGGCSRTIYLNAGDTLSFRATANNDGATLSSLGSGSGITIKLIP